MKISKLIRFDGLRSILGMRWWVLLLAITIHCVIIPNDVHAFNTGILSSIFQKPPTAGYVRTKAYIHETPEIGIGFHKVPIMVPMPMLIFRKKKHLITKPMMVPVCSGCSGKTIQLHPTAAAAATTTSSMVAPYSSYQPPPISSYARSALYGGIPNGGYLVNTDYERR